MTVRAGSLIDVRHTPRHYYPLDVEAESRSFASQVAWCVLMCACMRETAACPALRALRVHFTLEAHWQAWKPLAFWCFSGLRYSLAIVPGNLLCEKLSFPDGCFAGFVGTRWVCAPGQPCRA